MVQGTVTAQARERSTQGEARRKATPLESFGAWEPAPDRPGPVALIETQEAGRLPDLIPLRRQRMLESAFGFFRGTAIVQAADLGAMKDSGLLVHCCGDAHLANFGGFQAPDRDMVFDIVDFDETSRAPFEWDVMRLATSFEIAGRVNGLKKKQRVALVSGTVRAYREAMAQFAAMGNLDLWYSRLDVAGVLKRWQSQVSPKEVKTFEKRVTKARRKNSHLALAKMSEPADGSVHLVSNPPRLIPVRELPDPGEVVHSLQLGYKDYRRRLQSDLIPLLDRYHVVDIARNTVGVGSVGMRGWVLLLTGRDDGDPLFLQVKEAGRSVLEPYAGRSRYSNHGRRVVEGQRLLQASGDILLGWTRFPGSDGVERDHYVRQLWDGKMSPNVETMSQTTLVVFGEMCGWTLARGHARSGDRFAIAGYLGESTTFDEAMSAYARRSADQNDLDYAEAVRAWGGDLS